MIRTTFTSGARLISRVSIAIAAVALAFAFALTFAVPARAQQQMEKADTNAPSSVPAQAMSQMVTENTHAGVPAAQPRNPRYQISKEDIINLAFPYTPEFNQEVTVHPDGFITLLGAGDVLVAGKTVPELTEVIKKAYSNILHDPVINITLKDFQKPYFIAGGEIGHPGKYELRDDVTMTEAIAIAGGFTENSKHSQVLLFRRVSNDWAEVKVLNVKKMFSAGNLTEDIHLQPGDMFFVPQNKVSKIKKWIPYSMGVNATGF
jgi:polysaccharide export outer membrane protein